MMVSKWVRVRVRVRSESARAKAVNGVAGLVQGDLQVGIQHLNSVACSSWGWGGECRCTGNSVVPRGRLRMERGWDWVGTFPYVAMGASEVGPLKTNSNDGAEKDVGFCHVYGPVRNKNRLALAVRVCFYRGFFIAQ
ncbi:hypothetical protein SLEP1_g31031 [Rubroshorea leprosula]|uniref:Uncharacterized protein n=1 Tax=Rubroshorea leprosula TaxID=152421 RepID=A0AAV5KA97_9ROSI|nr:hypothetical protein SLEP1_g31031 [Rubroshorea leprosula]